MSPAIRETPVNTNGKIIHCRLRQIMGENNNMRIQELCDLTNLRRNTISALYNNKATRIDTITITAICTALKCTLDDLFVLDDDDGFGPHIPNEETAAAILEGRAGNVKSFNSIDALLADLRNDNDD